MGSLVGQRQLCPQMKYCPPAPPQRPRVVAVRLQEEVYSLYQLPPAQASQVISDQPKACFDPQLNLFTK